MRRVIRFSTARLASFASGHRFGVAVWLAGALVLAAFITRLILALRPEVTGGIDGFLAAFAVGFGFDLVAAVFALSPLVAWLALMPNGIAAWRAHRGLILLGSAASVFALLFVGVAEWIFWDEFASRFNFIAVDYLIYTQEVIGNIWQSYPVGRILVGLGVVAAAAVAFASRRLWHVSGKPIGMRSRIAGLLFATVLPVALFHSVSSTMKDRFGTDGLNQLAGNGMYEFVAAAYNNDLDFLRLYASIPEGDAFALVRSRLARTADVWPAASGGGIAYRVIDRESEQHPNVILVSVESFGAEFVGAWGNDKGLTPRFDALARESLAFTRVYATGNRTVRGLEALTLSLPPTPGQSIVKRPHNDNLFSLGAVFRGHGYETRFIYGGYGYFDNMSGFFSANGYRTVDRLDWPKARIHHENIWGIADEDLFDLAVAEIDATLAASRGKPVFAHIMTTSNHRPYTYPEGRIDIPSGTGRDGAVKYSDWAIGHFIDAARKKPWFRDTVFVITADHGANARGTDQIPVDKYRIPLIVYAPGLIKPGRIDRLMSQIDIAPTLLGRLHFSYDSKFFGQDIFRLPPGEERAFVANYQTVGYLRDGRLVTLQPRRRVQVTTDTNANSRRTLDPIDDAELVRETIAWYESAAQSFRRGLQRLEPSRPSAGGAGPGGS